MAPKRDTLQRADLFDNPLLSDTLILLGPPDAGRQASTGVSSLGAQCEPAALGDSEPAVLGQLWGHSVILCESSAYFKASLLGGLAPEVEKDGSGLRESKLQRLVLPVEEAEVMAARAVVKFFYTQKLEADTPLPLLLQMLASWTFSKPRPAPRCACSGCSSCASSRVKRHSWMLQT